MAAESERAPSRRRPALWNVLVFGAVLAAFAAGVWSHRWLSDDGLIVLRTVRQLVTAGGPVFNLGERVEANTSTAWTAVLTLPGLVPGLSLNWSAVVIGMLLAVAGVGFGLDAARRLSAGHRLMLPFGALVVVALPPFWDFGTSGLETGLVLSWLGVTWWLLVRRLQALRAGDPGRAWPAAFVLGLAPLVRPDLALVGLVLAGALVVLEAHRGRRRIVGLGAVAVAVPLAYEVFRAGYYGLLVPSPALAKEASTGRWQLGVAYLLDLMAPYVLWAPLALLVLGAAAVLAARRRSPGADPPSERVRRATVVLVAAPVLGALLLAGYVTWVGGDFMHARMLLPALFCLVLPLMAVPVSRWSLLPALAMGVWALVTALTLRPPYGESVGPSPTWIADERIYYANIVGRPNPITSADFAGHPLVPEAVAALRIDPRPSLAITGPGRSGEVQWWLLPKPRGEPNDTIDWLNLGITGELSPLATSVFDGVGLTNVLAAHATGIPDGRMGHDKDLPVEWLLADEGIDAAPDFVDTAAVDAARRALRCPRTRELLDSVRAPLTLQRFWDNLTGAFGRTAYRYPRDLTRAAECTAVG